jgi:hypothetical protein
VLESQESWKNYDKNTKGILYGKYPLKKVKCLLLPYPGWIQELKKKLNLFRRI